MSTDENIPVTADIHSAPTQLPFAMRPAWTLWLHRYRLAFVAAYLVLALGLDQVTKLGIRDNLARPLPVDEQGFVHYRPVKELVLIRGIFHLRYVENSAAAFSLTRSIPLEWRRPMLIGVTYLAIALLLGWTWRLKEPDPILILGFAMVLGGAAGNLVDRQWHGYVIDFIDWRLTRYLPSLPPWPTFNVADTSIVGGAACIIFRSFFPFERALQAPAAAGPAESGEVDPTANSEVVSS
ncbi:MAG: signal peptidase II [Pseudomonadota bacterium]